MSRTMHINFLRNTNSFGEQNGITELISTQRIKRSTVSWEECFTKYTTLHKRIIQRQLYRYPPSLWQYIDKTIRYSTDKAKLRVTRVLKVTYQVDQHNINNTTSMSDYALQGILRSGIRFLTAWYKIRTNRYINWIYRST